MASTDGVSSMDYTTNRTPSTGTDYGNTVFTDKKNNSELLASDFLKLMVTQLKNQDFMNPMDDTEYITQMAQFTMMQAINEMNSYSKTSYAMSLVGKNVTASRFTVSGDLDTSTGPVEKVSLVDNEYVVYVGGKKYSLDQIMEVNEQKETTECLVNPSSLPVNVDEISSTAVKVSWDFPTEDETVKKGLSYTVYFGEEGPFDTVEAVEAGTRAATVQNVTSETQLTESISGLAAGTNYYINIVVTDANGNKAVYKPVSVRTKSNE